MEKSDAAGGRRSVDRLLTVFAFLSGFFPLLSIACANISLGLFLLVSLYACLSGRESFRPARTFFDGPILAFLAVWLLSSLLGLDPSKSLQKLPSQLRFAVFYAFLWVGGGRHRMTCLKGYLWGTGVSVFYGALQWVVTESKLLRRMPEGLADYFRLAGGKFNGTRVHGSVHPLTFAELLIPAVFLGTARLVEADDRRSALRIGAATGAVGVIFLMTQSRGPWLGAAFGGLVLAALHPRRLRLALIAAVLAGGALLAPSVRSRLSSMSVESGDGSRAHRLVLWNNAWEVVRRYPVTGVGTGNLKAGVEKHHQEPGFLPNPAGKDGDAHNQYLHHWVERGPAGLIVLLWILAAPVVAAARILRRPTAQGPPAWVVWGLLACYAAFLVVNITERAFDDAEPALVFWMLASLLAAPRPDTTPPGAPPWPPPSGK